MESIEVRTKPTAKEIQIMKEVRFKSIWAQSIPFSAFVMIGFHQLMRLGVISAKYKFVKLGGIGLFSYMTTRLSSIYELNRRLNEEAPDGYFAQEERRFQALSLAEKQDLIKHKGSELSHERESLCQVESRSPEDIDADIQNVTKFRRHHYQLHTTDSELQTPETSELATSTVTVNTDDFARPPSKDALDKKDQQTFDGLESHQRPDISSRTQPLHVEEQTSLVKRRIKYGEDTAIGQGLSPGLAGQQSEDSTRSKYRQVRRNQYGDEIVD